MSVMADKNPGPPTPQQPQMPPPQWPYNMYNMYSHPYNMYSGYGSNPYYQYYARMQYMGGPQMGGQYRGFQPGGQLMPFTPPQQTHQQQQHMQPQHPQLPQPQQPSQQQNNMTKERTEQEKKNDVNELPPLPPGPPPPVPTQQNGFINSPAQLQQKQQQQSPKKSQQPSHSPQMQSQHLQQPATPRFFQPMNSGAPIRFNMTTSRARLMNLGKSPFMSQERPIGKKRKNKKNKQQQLQAKQQALLQQKQQEMMCNEEDDAPPLPATPPPPPPPPPPPNDLPILAINPPPPPPPPPLPPPSHSLKLHPPTPSSSTLSSTMRPHTPTSNNIPPKHLEEWPQSLKDYVNLCYGKCQTAADKDRIGIILKAKILKATDDGTLWVKDWASESLPLLESEISTMKFKDRLGNRLGPPLRSRSRSRSSSPRRRRSKRSYRSSSSDSSSTSSDEGYISLAVKGKNKNKRGGVSSTLRGNKKNNSLRHNKSEKSHFYSQFGIHNGDLNTKKEVLDKRAARFSNINSRMTSSNSPQSSSSQKKTSNSVTLCSSVSVTNSAITNVSYYEDTEFDLTSCHVVGTCRDIEKPYLRLTSAPDAQQVRPPEVLVESLSNVKEKWVQNHDYHYACEQLKSIRQDLTVQGVRDRLTVQVYETHARIALEKGDHAEFNQCQSQLRLLYQQMPESLNRMEFTAYRLLYYIFTKELMDVTTMISSLTDEEKENECVSHAVSVTKAWLLGSYHRLFKLYNTAPRMSSYLMDWFLARERKQALKVIIKAYRPTIPIEFIASELAFQSESLCADFLLEFGLIFADDNRTKIDCKASTPIMASV